MSNNLVTGCKHGLDETLEPPTKRAHHDTCETTQVANTAATEAEFTDKAAAFNAEEATGVVPQPDKMVTMQEVVAENGHLESERPVDTETHASSPVSVFTEIGSTSTPVSSPDVEVTDAAADRTVISVGPPIWAEVRQNLCDGVSEFYNSHQSGSYTKAGLLLGYLVDAEARPRDVVGAEVIVSTM